MPERRLVAGVLVGEFTGMPFAMKDGEVCALGAVGMTRDVEIWDVDPNDPADVADALDIAECLAQEIAWINDEAGSRRETPEMRWSRVRTWAVLRLKTQDGK